MSEDLKVVEAGDHLHDVLWARSILSLATLAAAAILFFRQPGQTSLVLLVEAGVLALSNIPFSLLSRRGRDSATCVAIIVVDTVLISVAVIFTGGVVSAVAVFYLWPIILASLLLAPWASYLVAVSVCMLYAALWLIESHGWLDPITLDPAGLPQNWVSVTVGVNLAAFMLIGLLTGMAARALSHSNAQLRAANRASAGQLADARAMNRQLRALSDSNRVFHRHHAVAPMLPEALMEVAGMIDADAAFARVTDESQEDGVATASLGNALPSLIRELQAAGVADLCRQKSTVVCDSPSDTLSAALLAVAAQGGYRRILVSSLETKSGTVGFICLLLSRKTAVDRERLANVDSLCAQLAMAIDTIQHTEELRRVNAELRRANEELTHLDKLKSDFMATMSHELRTPLTSIIGYSDMLLSGMAGTLDEKQVSFVGSILGNGEALLNLINDILDLTKIEAGRLELKHEPVDLRAALLGVLPVIKPKAAEKHIKVSTFLPTDLPRVNADANKLNQILLNLLTNAIKYTSDNGSVSVEARRREGMAEIWVTDTGVGIDKADQDKIFQRFTQIDSSATRTQGGTGLGLAITKELVELHGGSIRVQSQPGAGSSFVFTMPIWQTANVAARTAAS